MMKNAIALQKEKGQTMAEYAVVLGVITPLIVLSLGLLSGSVQAAIERTLDLVASAF
jgi:Flp pilus assembly pilin Flp